MLLTLHIMITFKSFIRSALFPTCAQVFIITNHVLALLVLVTPSLRQRFLTNVSWPLLAGCLVMTFLSLLGITAGYHRLYSHHSFKAVFGLRVFLALIGSISFQGI